MEFDHSYFSLKTLQEKSSLYRDAVFLPWAQQSSAQPLCIKEAHGVYLTLDDGTQLLDMKSQAFAANLGHNHGGMREAMVKAAHSSSVLASDVYSEDRLRLALELKQISGLQKAFFTLGGAEANENAIKMARMHTKRHKIITRYRSYHGATLATINFSGDYRRIPVDNAISGVVRFPDPYPRGSGQTIDTVRLLEEIIEIEGSETIAAIMLEGITGANGVFVPDDDYWPRIRELCNHHGIVLIADEVLSGFFRTGTWFAVQHWRVMPDIITMSKGLTGGYAPLGAVMVNRNIAARFDDETLWCGLTQYGHPWSCAVASAAIHHYEHDNIDSNVAQRGEELRTGLHALASKHAIVAETRSIGLLAAIDLQKSEHDNRPLVPYRARGEQQKHALLLQKLLKQHGVLALVRYGTIIVAPPLIINQQELQKGLAGIDTALTELVRQI